MRQRLRLLLFLGLFWLFVVLTLRGVFLLYNQDLTDALTPGEIALVFVHGLKMDFSLIGYFLMASGLILTLSLFTRSRWPGFCLQVLHIFLVVAISLLTTVDIELYRHWGFRINMDPLFYAKSVEGAALGSVPVGVVFKLLLICAALVVIFLFAFDRLLTPRINGLKPARRRGAGILLTVTALMFIPIRGSFSVAPMNTGFVYFHKTKPYANHAAINVAWNFLYNLNRHTRVKYPEDIIPRSRAEEHFRSFYPPHDSTSTKLFNTPQPNIILFILESFTADVIEALGGEPGITPHLNALAGEGVLFTNFYATGDRTDKGLVGILSGYPAQPITSIVKNPGKTQRLPYLNHYLRNLGYNTSFVYGGDVDFANFRSYLTNSQFDHITSVDDFPPEYNTSKWGVHDHIVFQRALQEIDTARTPFFKVILSLSSHEPFDVPMVTQFPGNDGESLFVNSCYYTDKSIGEFMVRARNAPWWENTVIIFIADHGHRFPRNKEIKDKERYRIPLLMVGGAITRDTTIHTIASQTDFANTLLGQLSQPSSAFTFSKNILSPSVQSFAVYFFNDGYGYIDNERYIIFDNVGKQFLRDDGASPADLDRSQAYQQILFIDYNHK